MDGMAHARSISRVPAWQSREHYSELGAPTCAKAVPLSTTLRVSLQRVKRVCPSTLTDHDPRLGRHSRRGLILGYRRRLPGWLEGVSGRVFGQQGRSEHAVKAADVTGERGEAPGRPAGAVGGLGRRSPKRSRWRTSSRKLSAPSSCSRIAGGPFEAETGQPVASIASVLVRSSPLSRKRLATSG
jgi:hypothetical protein